MSKLKCRNIAQAFKQRVGDIDFHLRGRLQLEFNHTLPLHLSLSFPTANHTHTNPQSLTLTYAHTITPPLFTQPTFPPFFNRSPLMSSALSWCCSTARRTRPCCQVGDRQQAVWMDSRLQVDVWIKFRLNWYQLNRWCAQPGYRNASISNMLYLTPPVHKPLPFTFSFKASCPLFGLMTRTLLTPW